MTLIEQIKADQVVARKAHLTAVAAVLTTLIGEAEMVGKNAGNRAPLDAEVLAVIKKFIKNIDETIRVLGDQDPRTLAFMGEKVTLEKYVPTQLSEGQLRQELTKIKFEINAGPKDMGKILGVLKAQFEGLYDGKTASTIAKELLS